jgi:hypothetical protein
MRIGVISEGHADRAVITNIIVGITGLDLNDIEAIRPTYNLDETDKALTPRNFSSWSVIKKECEDRILIDGFLAIEGQDFVVIHIDTAEAQEYGITRPDKKSENYCSELREMVINKINSWLDVDISSQLLYAVAIEEIDAWVLTIFEKKHSCTSANPKEKLQYILRRKEINSTSNYENYAKLSKPFLKTTQINHGRYLNFNCSFNAFYLEVEKKVNPKVETDNS